MAESWIECVTRVYKENKEKHGKTADGKYKYKLGDAMKDAKKVFKSAPKSSDAMPPKNKSRKGKKSSRGKTSKKM
jgi:hypothetical protein